MSFRQKDVAVSGAICVSKLVAEPISGDIGNVKGPCGYHNEHCSHLAVDTAQDSPAQWGTVPHKMLIMPSLKNSDIGCINRIVSRYEGNNINILTKIHLQCCVFNVLHFKVWIG